MSVIGRLDKQVEEIIINPLAKRPADDENSDAGSAENVAPQGDDSARRDERELPAREAEGEALPVWLL